MCPTGRSSLELRLGTADGRGGSSARGGGPFDSAGVVLGDGRPADDVPPAVEVLLAAVLVLEVVGVLPDVDAENRRIAVHERRVLVRSRDDGEARAVVDEPRPARAEALHAGLPQ